jgi:small GTP-binding protein
MRYFKNKFSDSFMTTIGMDKEVKVIKINKQIYHFNLWDTAGEERYRSLPMNYFQKADGIFLLFDINNSNSFENIEMWVNDVIDKSKENKHLKIYLIGNKIDLKRKVLKEDAIKLAEKLGIKYFESSNKLNLNIYEIVSHMIKECCSSAQIDNETKGAKIFIGEEKKKRKCC